MNIKDLDNVQKLVARRTSLTNQLTVLEDETKKLSMSISGYTLNIPDTVLRPLAISAVKSSIFATELALANHGVQL